jgi:hypothetical protein
MSSCLKQAITTRLISFAGYTIERIERSSANLMVPTIEVEADNLYKLEGAMLGLILEAILYRDTGVGKPHLTAAIDNADKLLSDWKQVRPAPMRIASTISARAIETRRVRARRQGWTGNNDYLCLSCRAEGKSIDESTYLDWPAKYDNGMPYCTKHAEKVT